MGGISTAALSDALTEQWGLTGIAVVARLQSYPTRTVYRVTTDQGTFAVKVDEAAGPATDAADEVQSAAFRALPGHVPGIRRTTAGALSLTDQKRRITVQEDITAGAPPDMPSTWRELGIILARLHAVTVETRPFAVPIAAAANELNRQAGQYSFAPEFQSVAARVRRIEPTPAAAIIHGEVNLSNVLRRPNGDLVLIDWDNAGAGPIALDLGYPLITVFLGEDLDWHSRNAVAFYSGYRAEQRTPAPSPKQIFEAALMHALRYMQFANQQRRWNRIKYALAHEHELIRTVAVG